MKRIFAFLVVCSMLMVPVISVHAEDQGVIAEAVDKLIYSQNFKVEHKITTPKHDKELLKQTLISNGFKLPENPEMLDEFLNDKINKSNVIKVDKRTYGAHEKDLNTDVQPMDIGWVTYQTFWASGPTLTGTERWVSYSTSWSGYDNYTGSLPIEVTEEKERTIITTLGFSGNVDLKVEIGAKAEYQEYTTSRFTIGTTVPAWYVWWHRPYCKYDKKTYEGVFGEYQTNIFTGEVRTLYTWVDGVNKVLVLEATQFEDAENEAKDKSANTPNPPSGQP